MESPGSPLVPILMTMSDRSSGELNGGLSPAQRPTSLTEVQHQVVRVTVIRDGGGYGMKVSGDKPVYVQSVKEGGAAERAGLQSGDKIIKVNGVTVVSLTHTEVVQLIKASHQVELIVQQSLMGSSPVSDHLHGSARITGPQPVDNEVQHQLLVEREQQYRMMIEKEQQYVDKLRGQLATVPQDQKRATELTKAERNLRNLQLVLQKILEKQRFQSPLAAAMSPLSSPGLTPNNNNPVPPVLPPRRHQSTPVQDLVVDNSLYTEPPPLPPRAPVVGGGGDEPNSINKQLAYPLVATCATLVNDDRRSQRRHHRHSGGQRHQPIGAHHQRTKSSPDSLLGSVAGLRSPIVGSTLPTPAEASRRLIASESLSDLNWDGPPPPPGTPPPPYPPREEETALLEFSSVQTDEEDGGGSPVRAATVQAPQPAIISMEDDELSDQEMAAAAEEYGPFKSISRLWEHLPHLAVFANYILTNSQPDCLLFYLLTDLYKEGSSAKEMRKWAFELHSCFLVPGAPLRLPNVDENVAREIDDVLVKEYDKEEILRKVFWKARSRAKEELSRQLQEFKAKRVAGLGTMWGPPDNQLSECYLDRAREQRLYEQLFSDKLQPYHQDQDTDPRRHYTMAGIATVAHRVFGVQSPHGEEGPMFVSKERSLRTRLMGGGGGGGQQRHLPRKLQVLGHQFVAQQYYQVLSCNHCQQIIFGIGPQGYQCAACLINLHRGCVKRYEDACPGPISKRDRGSGLGKFIRMRHQDPATPPAPSTAALAHDVAAAKRRNNEKERRLTEERDGFTELPSDNFGETARSPGSGQQTPAASREGGASITRSGSDRRPDLVREHRLQQPDGGGPSPLGSPPQGHQAENPAAPNAESPAGVSQAGGDLRSVLSRSSAASSGSKRKNSTNINRSESVKEVGEKRKQRRNISDPSHNNSVDIEHGQHQHRTGLHQTSLSDSGNSSNSNISTSGGDNSTEALPSGPASSPLAVNSDSDADPCEPVDWQRLVTEEQLRQLQPHEKKRQDVINELFQTESSHVRSLKVLYKVFYRTLQEHGSLRQEELQLVFGNIKEVLEVHRRTDAEMRRRRREDPLVGQLGELLVGVFDDRLRRAAAAFCERQQRALEFIKERRKRDSKLEAVLSECERNRKCRRLPLQGILPVEMQRLSKYPLLIERLIDAAAGSEEETAALRRAHQLSKDILNHVNEAAKVARNHDRLEEIQRHLDTSAYERTLAGGGVSEASVGGASDVDLTRYSLVHEGPMQLRRPTKAPVPVHILLLEEAVVLLQREGDRYVLKFFQSGSPAQTQPLSPIIRMSTLLVRTNAVHKSALFLVNTSTNNSQMYDLVAEDDHKRDQWFKHFSDAADAYNRREGKSRRPESGNSMIDVQDEEEPPPPPPSHHRRTASRSGDGERVQELAPPPEGAVAAELAPSAELTPAPSTGDLENDADEGVTADAEDGVVETGEETGPEEWPLVQPSQVRIASPPVHVAELRLTPLERLRRKDEEIALALLEKERLVGELLGIPVEHYEEIADMAGEDTGGGDMAALALAAWRRVLELERAIGQAQTEHITEARCVAASCPGALPVCAAETETLKVELPTVSTAKLAAVVGPLRSHITALMSAVKRAEEEREQYRREVHRLRERLHSEDLLATPVAPVPPLPVDETVSETPAAEEPDQREPEETKNGDLSEVVLSEENPAVD